MIHGAARDAAAHVFVEDLSRVELDERDAHHLQRVLRLRDGEIVTASDGAGRVRVCRWAGGRLDADGEVQHVARPSPAVTVGVALVKGDRIEWVVQKLTEIGVDRVVPCETARTVVRWDQARAERNLTRLRRIAREAAMQSRRAWLPEVTNPCPLGEAVDRYGPVALADPDGSPVRLDPPTIFVGPEGGWAPEEIASTERTVSLSDGVLRTETAAVVAGALLTALRAQTRDSNAKSGLSAD